MNENIELNRDYVAKCCLRDLRRTHYKLIVVYKALMDMGNENLAMVVSDAVNNIDFGVEFVGKYLKDAGYTEEDFL